MTDYAHTNFIDPARCVCLCQDGAPGLWAAVAVASDGTEHLLLAERDSLGDESVRYDSTCADAVHENLGLLPYHWRARVQLAPVRCGQPTQLGRPCRAIVSQPGQPCARHRATVTERGKA